MPLVPGQPEEEYGLIHGDAHAGNFKLDYNRDGYFLTAYDFEFLQKNYFAVDVGTFVYHERHFTKLFEDSSLEQQAKGMNMISDWLEHGFNDGDDEVKISRAKIYKGCDFRLNFWTLHYYQHEWKEPLDSYKSGEHDIMCFQ